MKVDAMKEKNLGMKQSEDEINSSPRKKPAINETVLSENVADPKSSGSLPKNKVHIISEPMDLYEEVSKSNKEGEMVNSKYNPNISSIVDNNRICSLSAEAGLMPISTSTRTNSIDTTPLMKQYLPFLLKHKENKEKFEKTLLSIKTEVPSLD